MNVESIDLATLRPAIKSVNIYRDGGSLECKLSGGNGLDLLLVFKASMGEPLENYHPPRIYRKQFHEDNYLRDITWPEALAILERHKGMTRKRRLRGDYYYFELMLEVASANV